jgi:hypothetical protein
MALSSAILACWLFFWSPWSFQQFFVSLWRRTTPTRRR